MPVLAIRLDDITPTMNWENFLKIKEIFDEYDIKPLIGIVPDNQDPKLNIEPARDDFWEFMQRLQYEDWSIAQHGYQHVYETKDSGLLGINDFSEFAGVPYEDQFEKLRLGQEILREHGIYTTIFMAPGHTYDDATRLALEQMKFQFVTDGYSDCPYIRDGIGYLPCTLSKPAIPRKFDTLCLHINGMTDADLTELKTFIQDNLSNIVDFLDVLTPEYFVMWGRRVYHNERRALKKRKKRMWAANNTVMQEYLQKTYHKNPYIKKCKRVFALPVLGVRLITKK